MITPKILYNAGSGDVTLNFSYPPVNKPGEDEHVTDRRDTITLSGKRQSIFIRDDVFKTIQLDYFPQTDYTTWKPFMDWALGGGSFSYYPDITTPLVHNDWVLEDTNWKPQRAFFGNDKFTLRFRQVQPDSEGS